MRARHVYIAFGLYVLVFCFGTLDYPAGAPSGEKYFLCSVGNAQSVSKARQASERLGLPGLWNIWGEQVHDKYTTLPLGFLSGPNTTWSSGLASVVASLGGATCEYVLFIDDDTRVESPQPALDMTRVLESWKPAVLALDGWEATKNSSWYASVSALYVDEDVQPLTAFDNGAFIIHSSLLDFVVPFSPHGEGGFHGEWTLPAHALALMLPHMFEENALLSRKIRYCNTQKLEPKAKAKVTNMTAVHAGARHPYEWPQNSRYKAFLLQGVKTFTPRYGVDIGAEHITWRPAVGKPPYGNFLGRLNKFYDLLSPAITNHQWVVKRNISRFDLLRLRKATGYRLVFIVFAHQRLPSLRRLLLSLLTSNCSSLPKPITLKIHVDWSAFQSTLKDYLNEFEWPHGHLEVQYSTRALGLRESILSAWHPTSLDEFALFLEDDIELSPHFAGWIAAAIAEYYYAFPGTLAANPSVGISLYAPSWSQVRDSSFSAPPHCGAYAMQLPCSWGAVYFPMAWRSFLTWMGSHGSIDPLIPNLVNVNRWPPEFSWKKYLFRKMVEDGTFMIYPQLEKGLSYSTNHVDLGTNEKTSSLLSVFRERYTVPLVQRTSPVYKHDLPAFENLPAIDAYERILPPSQLCRSESAFRFPSPDWYSFSRFTIVIPSHPPRRAQLIESLLHWQHLPSLQEIIVYWTDNTSDLALPKLRVPCRVISRQTFEINYRFMPIQNISVDAIFSLDDDVIIEHAAVEFAFYVWQMHPDQIVGFQYTARGFLIHNDTAVYLNRPPVNDSHVGKYSVALTGAAFFHRKYLAMYSDRKNGRMRSLRENIEEQKNGEDILMNWMISNATGKGPVFVRGEFKKERMAAPSGLWKRPEHFAQRAQLFRNLTLIRECWKPGRFYPAAWQTEWQGKPEVARARKVPEAQNCSS